eukprot:m.463275 g.463275  ORF g.463275 m.463275 type:complete len:81 (+) comp57031_c1_seq5:1743-1985(+)
MEFADSIMAPRSRFCSRDHQAIDMVAAAAAAAFCFFSTSSHSSSRLLFSAAVMVVSCCCPGLCCRFVLGEVKPAGPLPQV